MSPHLAWYAARAGGLVAWGLVSASVIWGLLLSTRLLGRSPKPAWLLDLHRFLGGLAVTFTVIHVASLIADTTVRFRAIDVLVPFASSWRPGAVALGVVAVWLLIAVESTSLLMRKLPRRLWRFVHLSSYLLFWSSTAHLLLAGTDARNPLVVGAAEVLVAVVVFLTLVAGLAPGRRRTSTTTRVPRLARPTTTAPQGDVS
jgi:DMSO/TMAO reductase YedYZ heme-binding membrane subunit